MQMLSFTFNTCHKSLAEATVAESAEATHDIASRPPAGNIVGALYHKL